MTWADYRYWLNNMHVPHIRTACRIAPNNVLLRTNRTATSVQWPVLKNQMSSTRSFAIQLFLPVDVRRCLERRRRPRLEVVPLDRSPQWMPQRKGGSDTRHNPPIQSRSAQWPSWLWKWVRWEYRARDSGERFRNRSTYGIPGISPDVSLRATVPCADFRSKFANYSGPSVAPFDCSRR